MNDDAYWAIDVPGLDEPGAEALLRAVESEHLGEFGVGSAVDPRLWFSRYLDRWTVEAIVQALRIAGAESRSHDLFNILGEMQDWLLTAHENGELSV